MNYKLLISLIVVLLFGLGIFALTGFYPQLAFNLGNRVTIYGSLILSFLIVMYLLKNKMLATFIFSIFIFTILGISDHWKSWTQTQLKIVENIAGNSDLRMLDRNKQLFVTYNQYSSFGKISHIEFFAEGISQTVFKLASGELYNVSPLNKRFYYENNKIIDKKYGTQLEVDNIIYIYDSKMDKLLQIKKENIQEYINKLPEDTRHWIQLLDKNSFIMKIVLKLMPRLEYAF